MSRIPFFIAEGLRALRRSAAPSAAAIVTVAVTIILIGVLVPVFHSATGKTDEIRDEVGLRVFLNDDGNKPAIPPAQVSDLQRKLEAIPHVASVDLVTQDEGLDTLGGTLEANNRQDLVAQLPGSDNPLPTSFSVKPDDLDNIEAVRSAITPPNSAGKPEPISPLIDDVGDSRDDAKTLRTVTGVVKWSLVGIAVLLLCASLLLVANTIRLSIYARRREVEVMQLVGATNWFIRWPFVVEGLVCGFIGGVIAVGLLYLGKQAVVDPLANDFHLLSGNGTNFLALVAVLLAAAMTISAIGSGLTLRRFLRV
jgi:cell division transport system permease protein